MENKIATRAFLLNENDEVLLGKRAKGIGKGQWALIGGKPEKGEPLVDAIRREVREEVGLDFEPDPKYYEERSDSISDPNVVWRVAYFAGKAKGEVVLKKDEIEEVVYVNESHVAESDLDIAFDHRERILDFYKSRQEKAS